MLAEAAGDPEHEIILALIGVGVTLVAALTYAVKAATSAKETATTTKAINKAVNDHPNGPSLYDLVQDQGRQLDHLIESQQDFAKRGWMTLPADLSSAAGLTQTIRDLQNRDESTSEQVQRIERKLDVVIAEIRDHVEWEMNVKHADNGNK